MGDKFIPGKRQGFPAVIRVADGCFARFSIDTDANEVADELNSGEWNPRTFIWRNKDGQELDYLPYTETTSENRKASE